MVSSVTALEIFMKTQLVVLGVIAFGIAAPTGAGDDTALGSAALRLAATEETDAPSRVSIEDQRFLQLAIDRGARVVQLSQRAQSKATSTSVKEFADAMVEDHGQSNRELMEFNQKLLTGGGPPYKQEDTTVRRQIAELDKLSGTDLDRRYTALMIEDHETAIEEFGREAKNGQDAHLKALAQKMLPVLQRHLEMARELSGTLEGR
jgi:putative membrane protein